MPSTMEVRSFGSILRQSSLNQRFVAVFFGIMRKSETGNILGSFAVHLRSDGHKVASHDDLFSFLNAFREERRRDGTTIDIEQGHVVVGDLMKKDDELDQIRVGLLPEGLFSFAEEIVQKRSDAEGQGVGVEVIVERVVAILGSEADFNVILPSAVPRQDVLHLSAEIPFDLENQPADTPRGIIGFVGKNLLGEGIHAATRFAGAYRSKDGNSGKQSPFGNGEPIGSLGRNGVAKLVEITDN